jgi:hypothetical protein
MGVTDVDRDAVLKAIAEYDEIGQREFLHRYGFGRARRYELIHDGGRYDSKAIVGAAHQHVRGRSLIADGFRGGEQGVVQRLMALGFTVVRRPPAAPSGTAASGQPRDPLVLIAPSYGNPATRQRFQDTLAVPVAFTQDRLRTVLAEDEREALLALHPDGTARFWGALPSHNTTIDRLHQDDFIVFTGQNRVQAIGTLGCKLRNETLAALLWPPEPGSQGWVNVYTVLGFQPVTDIYYPQLRALIGSSERDIFQAARALTADKSAAVINGLGLAVTTDEQLQDRRAEAALLAALQDRSDVVPAETAHVTMTTYEQPARTVTVHRAEAMLVSRYRDTLPGLGDHRLRSAVGHTDLYLADDGDIIEAKRAAEHRYVRDALGQLLDYALNTTAPVHRLTALFPTVPAPADIQLLHTYGIDCLYWDGADTFTRLPAPNQARDLMRPLWARHLTHSSQTTSHSCGSPHVAERDID